MVKDVIYQTNRSLFDSIYPVNSSIRDEKELLQYLRGKIGMKQLSILVMVWWSIWFFRNKRVFKNDQSSKYKIGEFIKRHQINWKLVKTYDKGEKSRLSGKHIREDRQKKTT